MNGWLNLLVALCVSEFVHNGLEIWGMRQKVQWLSVSLQSRAHGKWPININTKLKTFILHLAILISSFSVALYLLNALNFTLTTLLVLGIVILLFNYFYTTWKVDRFHAEIDSLIKRAKQQDKK